MSETPRTEAGRALLAALQFAGAIAHDRDAILAIEAEAASEPRPERTPSENVSDWDKVLTATEGHNVHSFRAVLGDDGKAWPVIECTCGQSFTEQWEFTDHIRRLVFDALFPAPGIEATEGP